MGEKDPRLYLLHIRQSCERILDYTGPLGDAWAESPLVLDAVMRNIEIIGEAAARFDADFRAAHTEIPWRNIIGTRNILIHAYDRVSPDIVSGIVDRDIPALLAAVRRLLGEETA